MVYMNIEAKKLHVLRVMSDNAIVRNKTHWSMYGLAKFCGYKPSTIFNNLLWDMVDDGTVRIEKIPYKRGKVSNRWLVSLPEYHAEQLALFG